MPDEERNGEGMMPNPKRCNSLKYGYRIGEIYCTAAGYVGKNCEKATHGVISPLCWGCTPHSNATTEREKVPECKEGYDDLKDLLLHERKKERDKVLELVSGAIENQKDHKEFLLTRGQKDIVLDIIDGIRAELRTAKEGE